MKVSRTSKVVIVSVLAILLIFVAVFYFFLSPREAHHPLIAIYPTDVPGHHPVHNSDQFLADLVLIKDLGFEGVRLHPADYIEYGYGRVADDLNDRCLEFVIVLPVNGYKFPENETYVSERITLFQNIAAQLENRTNLLWYALDYPFDWTRKKNYATIINSQEYHNTLQGLINTVHNTDPTHPIYLVSGMIENATHPALFKPPTDFLYVEGFGIQPYSPVWMKNEVDKQRIQDWLGVYEETGKKVYIAEWGVQTIEKSSNRSYHYGLANNESTKTEMIQEFINYIDDWNIYWGYFGLHDFHNESSDWGIVYDNNALKPSGETIRELLTDQK